MVVPEGQPAPGKDGRQDDVDPRGWNGENGCNGEEGRRGPQGFNGTTGQRGGLYRANGPRTSWWSHWPIWCDRPIRTDWACWRKRPIRTNGPVDQQPHRTNRAHRTPGLVDQQVPVGYGTDGGLVAEGPTGLVDQPGYGSYRPSGLRVLRRVAYRPSGPTVHWNTGPDGNSGPTGLLLQLVYWACGRTGPPVDRSGVALQYGSQPDQCIVAEVVLKHAVDTTGPVTCSATGLCTGGPVRPPGQ